MVVRAVMTGIGSVEDEVWWRARKDVRGFVQRKDELRVGIGGTVDGLLEGRQRAMEGDGVDK
eukprot:SAG31_NODE_32138_length_359_cov_1.188462_1_plen_61_part_10